MLIGVGKIVLDFYNNDDAPLKNSKLEKLCKEVRRKFNVSILEIADFDDPERCVIGFAAVIPDNWKMQSSQSFVRKICDTIDESAFARVMVEDCDFLTHGE
ncbi:DUF503 domain-containing protein [bacterium]|jgi:uncharacterized protein YlxP (DUF503 family)|nr:DUF503 domain-containing protein [bacterium]